MEDKSLALIHAWVQLSGILKNSRFTKGLGYNEAIVMLQLLESNGSPISIKEITTKTRMLKSQVNRTVNALVSKGLLQRCEGQGDRRICYVRAVKEKLDVCLNVHASSVEIAKKIGNIIGPEDTEAFIRIVNKLALSGYHL